MGHLTTWGKTFRKRDIGRQWRGRRWNKQNMTIPSKCTLKSMLIQLKIEVASQGCFGSVLGLAWTTNVTNIQMWGAFLGWILSKNIPSKRASQIDLEKVLQIDPNNHQKRSPIEQRQLIILNLTVGLVLHKSSIYHGLRGFRFQKSMEKHEQIHAQPWQKTMVQNAQRFSTNMH